MSENYIEKNISFMKHKEFDKNIQRSGSPCVVCIAMEWILRKPVYARNLGYTFFIIKNTFS